MNDETEPLDARVIQDLRALEDGGAPGFLGELIDSFLKQGRELLDALGHACRSGDRASLARVAHTFKGSAGSLGAVRLSTLCLEIEDVLSSESLDPVARLIREAESEFVRVRSALDAERRRP